MRAFSGIAIALLTAACADKLEADPAGNVDEAEAGFVQNGKFASKPLADGVTETKVDAYDSESWQRFDLDTGLPANDERTWDLEFSRYFIHTNSGVSGDGGVEVLAIDASFASVTDAPNDGYAVDREDSDGDTNSEPDNPFNSPEHSWFDYDVNKHTVSAHPDRVYVVRSSEGATFKLEILAYYDKAGTPSQLRFRWQSLAAAGD